MDPFSTLSLRYIREICETHNSEKMTVYQAEIVKNCKPSPYFPIASFFCGAALFTIHSKKIILSLFENDI
jgi:hypothetical protein